MIFMTTNCDDMLILIGVKRFQFISSDQNSNFTHPNSEILRLLKSKNICVHQPCMTTLPLNCTIKDSFLIVEYMIDTFKNAGWNRWEPGSIRSAITNLFTRARK